MLCFHLFIIYYFYLFIPSLWWPLVAPLGADIFASANEFSMNRTGGERVVQVTCLSNDVSEHKCDPSCLCSGAIVGEVHGVGDLNVEKMHSLRNGEYGVNTLAYLHMANEPKVASRLSRNNALVRIINFTTNHSPKKKIP